MAKEVYVAAVGLTKVDLTGRIFATVFDLFAEAYQRALEDSSVRSFDALQVGIMDSEEFENRANIAAKIADRLGLTGTHLGCEHGVCGACTVLVNGRSARGCLMLAVQADGAAIATVEGLAPDEHTLHPLQHAFRDNHGLQCGFCTPGFLMVTDALLDRNADPDDDEILEAIGGNLCRCTGYQNIVKSVRRAAELGREASS